MGGLSQGTRGFLESGGVPAPAVVAVTVPNPNTLVIQWNQPVSITAFGTLTTSYVIVPPPLSGAVTVTVVALLDPTHLQLTTTDQQNGASYQLDIAQGVVQNSGAVVNFATSVFFTGDNVSLTVSGFRLVDSTDLIVTFSRAVQVTTATIPGNYVFSPPLVVGLVERVTDTQYLVKTAKMQPNTIYGVTVSNVRALDGSVI